MKTIAVLGANGRVGHAVAIAFDRAGYRVVTVTRYASAVSGLEHATHRQADAMDKAALTQACRDADVVFNGLNAPYAQWAEVWPVMATNVLAACEVNGAVHLFPGNVYGFGENMPSVLDDTTPFAAQGQKGQIRIAIENQFKSHSTAVQTLIVYAGDFFGGTQPGSWFDLVLTKRVSNNKFVYPGAFDCMHAWAYLPDLARTFVMVADQVETCDRFERFFFEGHNVTGHQMHHAINQAMAQTIASKSVSWSLYKALGLFIPMLREVSKLKYLWFTPHQLDGAKLAARFGTPVRTPLSKATHQALNDLGIATVKSVNTETDFDESLCAGQ